MGWEQRSRALDLSAVGDGDLLAGLAILGPKALHSLHNVHALLHLAEHHVLAIQPLSLGSADKELGAIGVGPCIGHGEDARPRVLQDKVLIIKLLSIDGLAACAVVASEVTALAHKSWNNSVEAGTFVTKSFLASAQRTEILCRLWNFVCKQLETHAAQGRAIDRDVEKHGRVDHGGGRDGGDGVCRGLNLTF